MRSIVSHVSEAWWGPSNTPVPSRRGAAVDHGALPPAAAGAVDSEAKARVSGCLHLIEYVGNPVPVAVDVELEDLGVRGSGGDVLERMSGDLADRLQDAELGCRLGSGDASIGGEPNESADGREEDRNAELVVEERR